MSSVVYPPALAKHGWSYWDRCNCGGTLKYKFRNADMPELEVEWLVKYMQFRVVSSRQTKIVATPIEKLEKVLANLKEEYKK